jgi:hypothetical protein
MGNNVAGTIRESESHRKELDKKRTMEGRTGRMLG